MTPLASLKWLRLGAVSVWSLGAGWAIWCGTIPSPWFPKYTQVFLYPFSSVVFVIIEMFIETMGIYAILRWLPARLFWRTCVALLLVIGALLVDLATMYTDQNGIAYANGPFLLLLVPVTLLFALGLLVDERRLRARHSSTPA